MLSENVKVVRKLKELSQEEHAVRLNKQGMYYGTRTNRC